MSKQYVVWKHELPGVVNDLQLTRGARVVHVDEQFGKFMLWEMHDAAETKTETRRFLIAGTGNFFESLTEPTSVGSFLVVDGAYVFHVFEAAIIPPYQVNE